MSNNKVEDKSREFWNQWNRIHREEMAPNLWSLNRGDWIIDSLTELNLAQPEILEIGCADGWLSTRLDKHGKVTAMDLADEIIERARARYPDIDFRTGDFVSVDLPEAHFDVAVCLETLAHVPDQSAFIARAAGLLKPGGHLLLTVQNEFVWRRIRNVEGIDDTPIHNWLNMKQLKALVAPHFEVKFSGSITPSGDGGILRLVNSYRLNKILSVVVSPERITSIKERMLFGNTLVLIGQPLAR